MGIGAILGSGLIAFCVIPACCIWFSDGQRLILKRRPLTRDIIGYLLSLGCLIVVISRRTIHAYLGVLFFAIYLLYVCSLLFGRKARSLHRTISGRPPLDNYWKDNTEPEISPVSDHPSPPDYVKDEVVIGSTEVPNDDPEPLEKLSETPRKSSVKFPDEKLVDTVLEPSESDSVSEEDSSKITQICEKIWHPVIVTSGWICPDCTWGSGKEHLYPVTFAVALLMITLFSTIVTDVVDRWVTLIGGNSSTLAFVGVALVAIGAEIPDCVQSVTAARRGYGSMAISACLGSQCLNICIGLGLPWLSVAVISTPIKLHGVEFLSFMSACNLGVVGVFTMATIILTVVKKREKVTLTKGHVLLFIVLYVGIVITLGALTFTGFFNPVKKVIKTLLLAMSF